MKMLYYILEAWRGLNAIVLVALGSIVATGAAHLEPRVMFWLGVAIATLAALDKQLVAWVGSLRQAARIAIMGMALLVFTGCKSTLVEHQWADGARTRIRDQRLFHKQEAGFAFRRDTNGVINVQATVTSGADGEAIRAAFDAGMKAGEAIGAKVATGGF